MDFDIAVKMAIYKLTAKRGKIPNSTEVSNDLGVSNEDVKDAFERLYALRLLVLEPDDRSKIRMAPPFGWRLMENRILRIAFGMLLELQLHFNEMGSYTHLMVLQMIP